MKRRSEVKGFDSVGFYLRLAVSPLPSGKPF